MGHPRLSLTQLTLPEGPLNVAERFGAALAHLLKTAGGDSRAFSACLPFVDGEEANIRLILKNRQVGYPEEYSIGWAVSV